MMDQNQRGLGMLGMMGMMGSDMGVRAMLGSDRDDHDRGLRVVPISVDDVRPFFGHCGQQRA